MWLFFAGQKWVLTVGLLTPAPPRVSKDIDVWRPEMKAFVESGLTPSSEPRVELRPGLVGGELAREILDALCNWESGVTEAGVTEASVA